MPVGDEDGPKQEPPRLLPKGEEDMIRVPAQLPDTRAPSPGPSTLGKVASQVEDLDHPMSSLQSVSNLERSEEVPRHTELSSGDAPGQDVTPSQPADVSNGPQERPLNVTDALSYLDSVKMQFQEKPDVYNRFLDIMKDFKSQLIDTPGVIERVSHLFHGHPSLIQGFNTFLPAGYRIDCTTDALNPDFITVTTPSGTTTQATNRAFAFGGADGAFSVQPPLVTASAEGATVLTAVGGVNMAPALSYVQRVKARFANEPERYRKFLEILSDKTGVDHNGAGDLEWTVAFLSAGYAQGDVVARVGKLFYDAPDLTKDFIEFLPDKQLQEAELARLAELEEIRKANAPASEPKPPRKKGEASGVSASSSSTLPQKRKRKPVEREKEKETTSKAAPSKAKKAKSQVHVGEVPSPLLSQRHAVVPSSPRRTHISQSHTHHHPPPPSLPPPIPVSAVPPPPLPLSPADETQFFDRVKRALDNRDTYNEFLKLVNLFTQDIIDTSRLVRESRSFLGEGELMAQFKDILGWDERKEGFASVEDVWTRPMAALDRPSRNQLNIRYGSYRKLPVNEVNVTCSGRDEMCKSVLNDEWISQPTFASEDSGFLAHKKNIYEEALHRSEEERHEYDFHIEAIHKTILMLEPLNNKIAQLSQDERNGFKLKPNLGGFGKSIHLRVFKKIYGRDAGQEVYQAMQEVPALAIPVVLTRLKQKQEEWKRAQREWNKVWREVDARNFHKSLDHQGITFKTTDKKVLTARAFVSQIEAARDEQMAKRASLIDPLFGRTRPRHQLEFIIDDISVLQDALKLTLSFLDRTQGQINLGDRKKIETFIRAFVPLLFVLDPISFNNAFVPRTETVDSDMDADSVTDDAELVSISGSSRVGRNRKGGGIGSSGDLRKKLLKSEQAKSSRRTRAQDAASPSASRMASPAASDTVLGDGDESRSDLTGRSTEAVSGTSNSGSDNHSARRRYSFFTNTAFYVLFRLLEVLYSRLHLFKNMATKLAKDPTVSHRPNPLAIDLGMMNDLAKLGDRETNAVHFYDLVLESCEKLFDNALEQHVFEDQLRYMFGTTNAYKMFTVDKVVGAIIKQIQVVLSDQKSQELYDLLQREREIISPTTQDQINARRNTEKVIGPDENLFRMDWLPESKTVTVQLLGKDDSSFDDSEVLTGRWQAYVDSFVLVSHWLGISDIRLCSSDYTTARMNKHKAYHHYQLAGDHSCIVQNFHPLMWRTSPTLSLAGDSRSRCACARIGYSSSRIRRISCGASQTKRSVRLPDGNCRPRTKRGSNGWTISLKKQMGSVRMQVMELVLLRK
ncbi:hypothetical protein AcW1_010256 [Taiwanofungus camphoratus]|nr:hypothetical protein AcV5_000074 [Antrodia cinnamomea]KAI0945718.1 hypothetical protein AcW1_010256 [Antrodia cinnamomea]